MPRKRPLHPTIALRLEALIAGYPSLRAAARANGLSAGYLSHARRGTRRPGAKLLRVLGLTEKKSYESVK